MKNGIEQRVKLKKPMEITQIYKDADDVRKNLHWMEHTLADHHGYLNLPYRMNERFETAVDNIAAYAREKYRDYIGEDKEKECLINSTVAYYAISASCYEMMEKQSVDTLILGASIFILDACSNNEKLPEMIQILQEGEDLYGDIEEEDSYPPILTTAFDSRHIRTMYNIIKYRERKALETNKEERRRSNNELLNTLTAQGIRSNTNERSLFDRAMALVDKKTVDIILEDIKESLDVVLDSLVLPLREHNENFLESLHKLNHAVKEQNEALDKFVNQRMQDIGISLKANHNPLLMNQPELVAEGKDQKEIAMEIIRRTQQQVMGNAGNPFFMNDMEDSLRRTLAKIKYVNDLYGKMWDEYIERGNMMNNLAITYSYQCFPSFRKENMEKTIPDNDLIIQDPFAISFGLLYAVENGMDIAWLGGITGQFCYLILNQMPWARGLSDYYVAQNNTEDEHEEISNETEANDPYKMYIQNLTYDVDSDTNVRYTVMQAIYTYTSHLIPRALKDKKLCSLFKGMGFTDSESILMACIVQLYQETDYRQKLTYSQLQRENDSENEEEDRQELQSRISELKKRCDALESRAHSAEYALKQKQTEVEELTRKSDMDREELADLREIVFYSSQEEQPEEDDEEARHEFPYTVQKQTVVFGGHKTWLKAIRPMLEGNIRFYDKNLKTFDQCIINNADSIWIQINAISHSAYYRIIDQARLYNKPVHYFSKASALSGAIQVMEQDKKAS